MAKFTTDKIIIILTVVSAALLQLIDTSIVNVSLTQMMGNLGASFEDIGWVITSYAVSNIIMIALSGWMSATFGRKTYFAGSIILFTVASIFCGTSTSVWELVAFRFIQGIGGGGLISTAQAILIETFPKEELGLANAIYGIGVIVGPAIGPTLGGYITDNLAWQWIFFINIPVGIIATIFTIIYIKEPLHKMKVAKMDWYALALLILSIGSLQIVLEKGQSEDWFEAKYITVLAIIASIGIVLFIRRQLVAEKPIVNLRLFSNRSFTTGTLFNFILGFGLYGTTLVVPIFCQNLLGFTAMQTGLILLPGSLATAVMMPVVGVLLKRKLMHPAIYAGIGLVLFFLFSYQMGQMTAQVGPQDFFWPLIMRGFAMGLIFIPLTTISLSNLEGSEIPQGTSLSNMVRQLGGSIGIALITTYITVRTTIHDSYLSENVNTGNPVAVDRIKTITSYFMSLGYDITAATKKAYTLISGQVYQQASLLTYKEMFEYIGLFFLALVPLLIMFRNKKKKIEPLPPEEEAIEWTME